MTSDGPGAPGLLQAIRDAVEHAPGRILLRDLEKDVSGRCGTGRSEVRTAIRRLVEAGELEYIDTLGTVFLAPSFSRPVRIGGSIVLKPHRVSYEPGPEEIVIEILPGTSFGRGDHPSTRLALLGIEAVFRESHASGRIPVSALDIGTGSGILALAALKLGVSRALGLDPDPCARFEAAENARLNRLSDRFDISDAPVEEISGERDLVLANLRYPTLCRIRPAVYRLTSRSGFVVLSGVRTEESESLVLEYEGAGFSLRRSMSEKGWSGHVFQKCTSWFE